MATQRTKLRVVVFICLGVLLFALGCILPNRTVYPNSLEPVRRLRVTIGENQRDELFDQFQLFAEKHDFEIQITDYGNMGEYFQVWIAGEDIQIVSEDEPGNPRVYSIDFLARYPGYSVGEDAVDELLNDLKSYLNEIPNLTITEEK